MLLVASWLGLVALGVAFTGDERGTELDYAAADAARSLFGEPGTGPLQVLLWSTEPLLLAPLLLVVCALLVRRGRWQRALLLVAAPALAVLLTSLVAKPLIGRRFEGEYLALPSGHTAGAVALFAGLLLAVWPTRWRLLGVFGIVLLVAAAGWALIGYRFHYLTDVVGGWCIAVGSVLLVWRLLVTNRVVRWLAAKPAA